MDKLKSLWAKFKVQISFVAGCLVVATSVGTCSFDPSATSEEVSVETTEATTTEATTGVTTTETTADEATAADATTETTTETATTADVTTAAE